MSGGTGDSKEAQNAADLFEGGREAFLGLLNQLPRALQQRGISQPKSLKKRKGERKRVISVLDARTLTKAVIGIQGKTVADAGELLFALDPGACADAEACRVRLQKLKTAKRKLYGTPWVTERADKQMTKQKWVSG
jgi:hypothetical protein